MERREATINLERRQMQMSRYKYWSTDKLLTLLKELELSLSGSHLSDVYLKHHVENILYKRRMNND